MIILIKIGCTFIYQNHPNKKGGLKLVSVMHVDMIATW